MEERRKKNPKINRLLSWYALLILASMHARNAAGMMRVDAMMRRVDWR